MSKLCKFDMIPMRSEHSSKSSLTLNYIPKSSLTLNYAAVQHVMLYYTRRTAACYVILSHLQCYTITLDPLRWKMTPPVENDRDPLRWKMTPPMENDPRSEISH